MDEERTKDLEILHDLWEFAADYWAVPKETIERVTNMIEELREDGPAD